MKITKNIITRNHAHTLAKEYVAFVEGDHNQFDLVLDTFNKLKRGQSVITFLRPNNIFIKAKVSSVRSDSYEAIDGPIIRITNGEYSWRVDGDGYAYPIN